MQYKAAIRHNLTGEVRVVAVPDEFDENTVYLWEDGNYACDCNRHTLFGGEGEVPCGSRLYTALYLENSGSFYRIREE